MKVVGLGGMPGTGKTTVMLEFLKITDDWKPVKATKLLDALYSESLDTYVLGKYSPYHAVDGVFQGTDKLAMNVQPEAISWFKSIKSNVVFEGDRLFTNGILMTALEVADDCQFYLLETNTNTLAQRYEDRGSDQSDKFISGRKTKYENIASDRIIEPYVKVLENTKPEDAVMISDEMKAFLSRTDITVRDKAPSIEDFF